MIMLSIFAIPLLVLLLIAVFIISASGGTTYPTSDRDWSDSPVEITTTSQSNPPSLPLYTWQADFSSLDAPTGE